MTLPNIRLESGARITRFPLAIEVEDAEGGHVVLDTTELLPLLHFLYENFPNLYNQVYLDIHKADPENKLANLPL